MSSSAAELSAGEGWVLFGLGFFGLLPPSDWQEIAAGFPSLGDISFAYFYNLTGNLLLLVVLLLLLLLAVELLAADGGAVASVAVSVAAAAPAAVGIALDGI